jgi:flavin-dependent dehydrogenase
MKKYDFIVIGAATAGSYFAKLMAEKGYKVLLLDKLSREKLGRRLDIFHIDKELFPVFNVPEPVMGDPEYVMEFDKGYTRSPSNSYPKTTTYPFIVMHMPEFILRLNDWAASYGAEVLYGAEFKDFTYGADGKISGAVIIKGGKEEKLLASMVVDASGINSPVRRKLKPYYGVENFEIKDDEKFYVILRYVKLLNPDKDRVLNPTGWLSYKSWIAPQHDRDGAIIGIGQAFSYDYAEKIYQEFIKNIPLPPHELQFIEKGTTPYRRPPYSFVADNFLVLGDSACMTKPFSGEGVTAAWRLCLIASEVIDKTLKDNKALTRENLWDINSEYQRGQGAKFAYLMASVVGAASCSLKEQEFMFKEDIVFNDKQMTESNRNFEVNMTAKDTLAIVIKMLKGIITGKFRLSTVKSLLGALSVADKIKKHYTAFPSEEKDFDSWEKKAEALWANAGSVANT